MENSFLKKVCGSMAEAALAEKLGVSSDELFDENGCFYRQYQDMFNRLYDFIENMMTGSDETGCNHLNRLMKTSNIYTTGAFLFPVRIMDENGGAVWMWAVSQFEDDSYCGGKICNPAERAETAEKLLLTDDEDDKNDNSH